MNTENELNKTLSELYSNLEDLQSAREQVEIVTKSSDNLTNSTAILLEKLSVFSKQFGQKNTNTFSQLTKNLDNFENKIEKITAQGTASILKQSNFFKENSNSIISKLEKNTDTNNTKLKNNLINFETKINSISEKGNKSISSYINSFKKEIVIVIDQFSKQISENEKNLTAINSLNNEKISEKIKQFERTTNDLKVNAEQGIEKIKLIAIEKIEKQEEKITKTILYITETNLKTERLIKVITNYDIPNSLENIDKKLECVIKENKLLKTMLFAIIGLLIFSVLGLFMKFM
ncbi:hypothetical protein [Tenacibaculum finnmarkense]|uniref:hypothetical protein n=1 Tax=Tenacibaculum finnmarkense TaxID=2781243 RepID=UPI000C43C680|nr:hypothetical protein [Tenacibaculum finnmarkense]MBE7633843.1 hypothetical protein [Tenacibaculum finnmarkense genomovar ulcerans]MBE7660258.1 hypothetical protein [Tenacibaculum finnmarkense genomovar finnmarkense]MCD8429980.1 hypothetical protein [Tenacibaculum finnmarkense genomovar ulcerans]MCD8432553.1 hypothetical protein [Tenacibaculum finnmarkense genomovar ulcerans]MCG8251946.1 hypothetical protein [Tenacibaculum finnmarkense genomovar finnmarkense]